MNPRHILKWFIITSVILASLTALFFNSWSCKGEHIDNTALVSIGTTTSEVNALLLVAQANQYFTANGLNIRHEVHPSGLKALEAMLSNEVDLATGSEYAFVGKVLSGEKIRTIGVINRSSTNYLIARKDKGITHIHDLKGKRIGVPFGSRPQFALDRFLYLNDIASIEANIVNVPIRRLIAAFLSGEVDAVTAWQPYIEQAKEKMRDGVVVWSTQENQPSYTLVMCREQWTAENPEPIKRLLKAMIQAEDFMTEHPDAAKSIIQKKLNYDDTYMDEIWHDYRFSVLLDQALVVAMEDEARWMINNHIGKKREMPNFADYFYVAGLKGIRPEAVNIIR